MILMMRRSFSRPQQLREQLLQAIDAQNNIHNMAAVLEVIYCLENYPMTKEALVETRLGKLINDVRKRCTDEDLVKRLKTLVRSWQRLVEVNEATEKRPSGSADRDDSIRAEFISRSTQTFRTFVHSKMNPRVEMSDGSSGKTRNCLTNLRRSKIPIRAVNPYSSSHMSTKQSSVSWSLRTSPSIPQDNQEIVRYLHKSQRPVTSPTQCSTKNPLMANEPAPSTSSAAQVPSDSFIQDSHTKTEQRSGNQNNVLKPTSQKLNLFSLNEVSNGVKDQTVTTFEDKTVRNQHRPFTVKHNGHLKPAQAKESKLTYDHHTRQIKSMPYKTSDPREDGHRSAESEARGSEKLRGLGLDQQTNSSEPSQSEIIKPELKLQSSSGSQTSGVNLLVAENLKQGRDDAKECRKMKEFIPEFSVTELPGVSRELTEKDLHRIQTQRWHGVNGCYDNRYNWYDWTQCIPLDSYGDGNTLKISPYVCITDFRF